METSMENFVKNLESYTSLFINILKQPYSNKSDFCLRSRIICFLTTIMGMDWHTFSFANNLLEESILLAWDMLSKCSAEYIKVIMGDGTFPCDYNELDKESPVYFMNLVESIFKFLYATSVKSTSGKTFLVKSLPDILYNVIIFMCITTNMETEYLNAEDTYYNEERDDCIIENLRSYVIHILKVSNIIW